MEQCTLDGSGKFYQPAARQPCAHRNFDMRRRMSSAPARNAVRIIGGTWRRRLIRFPDVPDLRPTPDRVRETVFNWLGQDLTGLACLDLFAGSGALGFEAASRGASSVILVEPNTRACAALVDNARMLGAAQVKVHKGDALEFLSRDGQAFDVVFLDPPFRRGVDPALLERIALRMRERAKLYVESDAAFAGAAGWQVYREARAGKVYYRLLERVAQS
jgi:16S rRNA (guanine966-N2)-methyltransferase